MNALVTMAKALADPTRVRILAAVHDGELCVCELCDALDVTQSTLSTHLQVIRDAGLLEARKAGKWTYYRVHPQQQAVVDAVFKAFRASLESDQVLRQDRRKLQSRLTLRNDGACCVGFPIRYRAGAARPTVRTRTTALSARS
jgi:ArsR family transcriptional regulator